MFKITNINVGRIAEKKTVRIEFPYEDIENINKMESPCNCGIPSNIKTENKVVVEYTAGKIPPQILQQGKSSYQANKVIKVWYTPKSEPSVEKYEELIFTAVVTKVV